MTDTTAHTAVPTIDADDVQARAVAEHMLRFAAGGPTVAISQADLAEVTGMPVRTLRRVLDRLLTAGWIEVEVEATPNEPAVYDVTMIAAAGVEPAPDPEPEPKPVAQPVGARRLTAADVTAGNVTVGERVLVAPGLLEDGSNVRRNLRMDDALVESVRTLGVLSDLHVYPTLTGLAVLSGHRRLAAALKAGVETVPALVVAVDGEESRITRQVVENELRTGMLSVERADAIEQLCLLGVPTQDIHRTTGAKHAEIKAARAVASAHEDVRNLGRRLPSLDLVTLAKVADLEEQVDAETIGGVLEEIEEYPERVDHVIERASQEAALAKAETELRERLAADGVRIVTSNEIWDRHSTMKYLSDLIDTRGEPISVEEHGSCPGDAVVIGREYSSGGPAFKVAAHVCTDWAAHGHRNRYARPTSGATSGPQPEAVKAERAEVRRNNADMEAANAVRRRWITENLLHRAKVPADATVYEVAVLEHATVIGDRAHLTSGRERLSLDYDGERFASGGQLSNGHRLLALALAFVEGLFERDSWRAIASRTVMNDHLRTLIAWGYQPSPIENTMLNDEEADA